MKNPPTIRKRLSSLVVADRDRRSSGGFTLLELCIVLILIAILVGSFVPSIVTALTEQAIRNDSHQLAIMVKTGMIQSAEQNRAYALDFTTSSIKLHPADNPEDSQKTIFPSLMDKPDAESPAPVAVEMSCELTNPTKMVVPDPQKKNGWKPIPKTMTVLFRPGELCPLQTVRFTRGEAYIEQSFNGLTGNVDKEESYIP